MSLNWRAIWTIVGKDLRLIRMNKNVLGSLIILPLIFLVVMPGVMVYIAASGSNPDVVNDFSEDFDLFYASMPDGIRTELQAYDSDAERLVLLISAYMFAPLFLMVPIMVSTTFGADSFAGEHERKTMEGLLYAPITDLELYLGKLLMAWIPALLVALLGGVIYATVINVAAWSVMERVFFPNLSWLTLVLWFAPAVSAAGLAAVIFVSARAKTVQEAIQVSSMLVIPVILLIVAQMAGVIYLNVPTILIMGAVVWAAALVVLWLGAKRFQRGELIARL
ncbi:MAG: ABC transporter permease subunit [Anaerolinea sp.]|nr:ABC transporter permease subunit [Anaerolinea sp.]